MVTHTASATYNREKRLTAVALFLPLLFQAPPKGPMHNYDPDFIDDSYDYGGYNRFDRDADRRRSGPGRRGGRGGNVTSSVSKAFNHGLIGFSLNAFVVRLSIAKAQFINV